MQEKPHPFWIFSLKVYVKPGVSPTCLAVQDEYGGDVNLLLFCCWQGCMGHSLNKRFLRSAMGAVADWQLHVLQPLRLARRNINMEYPAMPVKLKTSLSKDIASAELDAEYLEQRLLARCAAEHTSAFRKSTPARAIAVNLRRYFELLKIPFDASLKRHAETLLAACQTHPQA